MIRSGHLNWILVLGLIGLGFVLLWPGMTTDEVDWYVPVKIENLPAGLVAIKSHVKGIEIRARGPGRLFKPFQAKKLNTA